MGPLGASKTQMETLSAILLDCGKPGRRLESCGECLSAAEEADDASEPSQGDRGPSGRWKHPRAHCLVPLCEASPAARAHGWEVSVWHICEGLSPVAIFSCMAE